MRWRCIHDAISTSDGMLGQPYDRGFRPNAVERHAQVAKYGYLDWKTKYLKRWRLGTFSGFISRSAMGRKGTVHAKDIRYPGAEAEPRPRLVWRSVGGSDSNRGWSLEPNNGCKTTSALERKRSL